MVNSLRPAMAERILVLGAAGFIGKALCEALRHEGSTVVEWGRPAPASSPDDSARATRAAHPTSGQIRPMLENCDAVVHLASDSTPSSTAGKPLEELDANLHLTLALLTAMQETPKLPLLFLSSAGAIYGARENIASTESDLPEPRSYHGAAKVAAEQFTAAYCRQFAGVATIIRPTNVYGPGQTERAGFGIVPHAFGAMRRAETLTVWGDGSAARDYLYIDDLVSLCLCALSSSSTPGARIYNASSGTTVSLNELFVQLESAAELRLMRRYDRVRSIDAMHVAVDNHKASSQLGWSPQVDLQEGLKRTWAWIKAQPG